MKTKIIFIFIFIFSFSKIDSLSQEKSCIDCHSMVGLQKTIETGEKISVYVDEEKFRGSAHGKFDCSFCHVGYSRYPHPSHAGVTNCGNCHEEEKIVFNESIHGKELMKGNPDVPGCPACHGTHNIRKIKELRENGQDIDALLLEDCAKCHGNPELMKKYGIPLDRYSTYEESFHGRADKYGSNIVAKCASCHGAHAILPESNPNSTVNKNNLVKTCGKCHKDAERVASVKVHISTASVSSLKSYNSLVKIFFVLVMIFSIITITFYIQEILSKKE